MIKLPIIFLFTCTCHGLFGMLTLIDIYSRLENLASTYPQNVKLFEIGKSFEGRSIYAMSMQNTTSHDLNDYTTIVAEFGTHAREWASPISALFLIEQFITNPTCSGYWKRIKWYIIPVTNPDGFHYSVSKDSLWRKNRRTLPDTSCIGVDLNRNFPTGWELILSKDPCEDVYSGPYNFSEPEAIALDSFMKGLAEKENVTAYVSVHSCAQCILHPYGYTLSKIPENLEKLVEVGQLMGKAMERVAGNNYPVMSAAELYQAGGGSDDWSYEMRAIPLVYTLELGYKSSIFQTGSCFHPAEAEMNTLVLECFAALGALAKILDPSIDQERSSFPSNSDDSNGSTIIEPTQCPFRPSNSVLGTSSFLPTVVLQKAMVFSVLWIGTC